MTHGLQYIKLKKEKTNKWDLDKLLFIVLRKIRKLSSFYDKLIFNLFILKHEEFDITLFYKMKYPSIKKR